MTLPVDPTRYLAFMGAMAILAVTPGPANLFFIAHGMARGRRAVLVSIVGMNTATLIWYVAAALGLGALALAFPQAVKALIVVGALYLLWLAYKAVKGGFAKTDASLGHVVIQPHSSAYWDGFMVQIANPKILLFFGAVLPPFLDFKRPLPAQFVMFAVATVAMDAIATVSYGFGGAALASRMSDPRFRKGFGIAVAVVLCAAAGLIVSRL